MRRLRSLSTFVWETSMQPPTYLQWTWWPWENRHSPSMRDLSPHPLGNNWQNQGGRRYFQATNKNKGVNRVFRLSQWFNMLTRWNYVNFRLHPKKQKLVSKRLEKSSFYALLVGCCRPSTITISSPGLCWAWEGGCGGWDGKNWFVKETIQKTIFKCKKVRNKQRFYQHEIWGKWQHVWNFE